MELGEIRRDDVRRAGATEGSSRFLAPEVANCACLDGYLRDVRGVAPDVARSAPRADRERRGASARHTRHLCADVGQD